MQADTEHQQHHADIGQLEGQMLVNHHAGAERPHHDTRQQISHQRRQFQALGSCAQHKGQANADDQHGNER